MNNQIISQEEIVARIYFIRGKKIILDTDLAQLYEVEVKVLNQAVKRNQDRFPDEFMFQLTEKEFDYLRSQIVTSNRGGRRYLPFAFTDYGVLMLSSVLRSERAIQVNIQIMKTFTKLREMLAGHKELREKIESMERKYDQQFRVVFEAIKHFLLPSEKPKQIGFIKKNPDKKDTK